MPSRNKTLVNAFNLVPVVESVLPDRPKIEVACMSVYERYLYVGTHCGLIVYYLMEENKTPLGKVVFQSKVKGRIQLGSDKRKAVQQLTVVASHKKLLALVDGFLYVMAMNTLELFDTGQKIPRIQCYCINESRSAQSAASGNFEILVAPQRRKFLQMYALNGDKMVHTKDYSIPEPALLMSRDGESVCVALTPPSQHSEGKYIVLNIEGPEIGKIIDLLNYEPGSTPIVKRTSKGEFLINAGTFGVVAFVSGMSNRPPVEWNKTPPKSATYMFPYVVAWSEVTGQIHVFNLLDQKCVQEIPFPNGRFLGDFSGKLYAALGKSIYCLPQVPLREQVDNLLEKQLVEEAVLLAETIAAVDSSKNKASGTEYMCEVKKKAAFIYFSIGSFSQAETLFVESGCDPREVIVLYSDLLPSGSSYKPGVSPIPSVEVLGDLGHISVKEAKKFLIRYLKEVRTTFLVHGRREDVDTSLVKLLAQEQSPALIPYIENHELYLSFDDSRKALETNSCFFALGLLFYYSNQASMALDVWTKISDGDLKDKRFPGFPFIVDFLAKYPDNEVFLKYSRWALERDEEMASRIFSERETGNLSHSQVLEFLSAFPIATVSYLEHIIQEKGSKEENFHTKLASYYIDDVLKLYSGGESSSVRLKAAREKLLAFLENSNCYRAAELLSKVHDTELHRECALLYGMMEEHEKALSLLAHKLKDFSRAEEYCNLYSQDRSRAYRQNLYQILLRVYLQPKDEHHDTLIRPALSLLNSHGQDFDAGQVLELLPPDWPITTVKTFLCRSLRSTIDTFRTDKIEHSLARGENLQVRSKFLKYQYEPVVITESTRCPVCNLPFNDAAFVRYPNGTVTHLKCGRNKSICPVTGTWFSGP